MFRSSPTVKPMNALLRSSLRRKPLPASTQDLERGHMTAKNDTGMIYLGDAVGDATVHNAEVRNASKL